VLDTEDVVDDGWDNDREPDWYLYEREPSCGACDDQGVVGSRWWGRLLGRAWRSCPHCNARRLHHLLWRVREMLSRRGRGYDDEPPF